MNANHTPAKVLIVDDDPVCVDVLQQLLADEELQMQATQEPAKALILARSWQPDLILLDVDMPECNGYEVCNLLKQDPATCDITILFVTGKSDVEHETKGLELGAMDYIAKPFDISVLKARIRNHLALHQKNQTLAHEALTDSLTGILNRRGFDSALEQEWNRCARYGRPMSLMMVDIDCFKGYNDHFGHQQGDVCLQQVAGLLREGLRRAADVVARVGGEEFAVLLPEVDEADMFALAEILRQRIEAAAISQVPELGDVVTVSIGCCTVQPELDQSPQDLLQSADKNLYQAKSLGRNRVVFAFDEDTLYS